MAVGLLFVPLFIVGAAFRPAWLILLLVAIPPGLLTFVQPRVLAALLGGALLAQAVVRGSLFLDARSGLYPLVALIGLSFFFPADVGFDAVLAGDNFLKFFTSYTLLLAVTYNAVRLGDLKIEHLGIALLIGIFGTALIKIAHSGLGPSSFGEGAPGSIEGLYFGRNFAFLAVLGFGVSFGMWTVRRKSATGSLLYALLTGFFLVLTATAFVRGAWVSAVLTVLLVAWFTGRRSYWLFLPIVVVMVLMVPVARERVAPGADSPVDITTGRWGLWTILWEDHVSPAMPLGNGFGYAWSLTPDRLFGFEHFLSPGVSSERSVLPHNDFLYWMIEFGLVGLTLIIIFWLHVFRTARFLLNRVDPVHFESGLILLVVLVTAFVAHLTANTYAVRPLAERFFITAGFLFGIRSMAEHDDSSGKSPVSSRSRSKL
jgi:hypothetical protein